MENANVLKRAGIAKHIHEQRIGTIAGIEFPPGAIRARQEAFGLSVNFIQAAPPCRMRHDGAVRLRKKISMTRTVVVGNKADGGRIAIALAVREAMLHDIAPVTLTQHTLLRAL